MPDRDFAHDQPAMGKKLRILTIADTRSRSCPTVAPWFSGRGEDVVRIVERGCQASGYPSMFRMNNTGQFIPRDLDLRDYANDVVLGFARPKT